MTTTILPENPVQVTISLVTEREQMASGLLRSLYEVRVPGQVGSHWVTEFFDGDRHIGTQVDHPGAASPRTCKLVAGSTFGDWLECIQRSEAQRV